MRMGLVFFHDPFFCLFVYETTPMRAGLGEDNELRYKLVVGTKQSYSHTHTHMSQAPCMPATPTDFGLCFSAALGLLASLSTAGHKTQDDDQFAHENDRPKYFGWGLLKT